jgi:hypothetical protein
MIMNCFEAGAPRVGRPGKALERSLGFGDNVTGAAAANSNDWEVQQLILVLIQRL